MLTFLLRIWAICGLGAHAIAIIPQSVMAESGDAPQSQPESSDAPGNLSISLLCGDLVSGDFTADSCLQDVFESAGFADETLARVLDSAGLADETLGRIPFVKFVGADGTVLGSSFTNYDFRANGARTLREVGVPDTADQVTMLFWGYLPAGAVEWAENIVENGSRPCFTPRQWALINVGKLIQIWNAVGDSECAPSSGPDQRQLEVLYSLLGYAWGDGSVARLSDFELRPMSLFLALEEVRDDRGSVLSAVSAYGAGRVLQFASERLKNDPKIVQKAVRSGYAAFEFAGERLRNDRTMVLAAVAGDWRALRWASERLRDDRTVVLATVRQGRAGTALQFASERLRNDRSVVIEAVRNCGQALDFGSNRLRNDRTTVLAAVRDCGTALQFASDRLRDDRTTVLAAVGGDSCTALKFASARLRDDRGVALAALHRPISGYCRGPSDTAPGHLKFVSERVRTSRSFWLALVKRYGRNLEFAPSNLHADRGVVSAAVQQDHNAFAYASKELKRDKEMRRIAGRW